MKAALLFFALAISALAQSPHTGGLVTRDVAQFTDLETKLMTAVENKDKATLQEMLTDDFELRRSSAPGQGESGEDWIAKDLPAYDLHDFRNSQMAVHKYGDSTVVASMNYWQSATVNHKARSGNFFVVDVWTRSGDAWKLSVRYVGPAEKTKKPAKAEPPAKY